MPVVKSRKVRTPAGSQRFDLPIGAPIVANKKFDGPVVHRGVNMKLSKADQEKIAQWLQPPTSPAEYNQRFKVGKLLVQRARQFAGHQGDIRFKGVGRSWTTSQDFAEVAGTHGGYGGMAVVFTARVRKVDIEDRPEEMTDMQLPGGSEEEVRLKPNSAVQIVDVKVVTHGGRWISVWDVDKKGMGQAAFDREYGIQKVKPTKADIARLNDIAADKALMSAGLMIKDLDADDIEAVQDAVHDALYDGWTDARLQRRIKRVVGLGKRYQKAVAGYQAGLVANGTSPSKAARMADAYADRLRKSRASTIADHEVRKVLGEAQREEWLRKQQEGVYSNRAVRIFRTHKDERRCPTCRRLNGRRISLQATDPAPPLHPNCRCWEELQDDGIVKDTSRVSKADVQRSTAKAEPRDADSDGWVYEGTPRKRPARPAAVAPRRRKPAAAPEGDEPERLDKIPYTLGDDPSPMAIQRFWDQAVVAIFDVYESYVQEAEDEGDIAMTHSEFQSAVIGSMRDVIRGADFSIRVPPGVLPRILEDGRIKTQFETGQSRGDFAPDFRRDIEKLWGPPNDRDNYDDRLRPVYGYLSDETELDPEYVQHYGDIELLLNKKRMKDRTTVTIGDSFGQQIAVPYADVDTVDDKRMVAAAGNYGTRAFARYNGQAIIEDDSGEYTALDVEYIEAQYHGGVVLDDIERIIFHDRDVVDAWELWSSAEDMDAAADLDLDPDHIEMFRLIDAAGLQAGGAW